MTPEQSSLTNTLATLRFGSEREKNALIEAVYKEQFWHTLNFVKRYNGSYEDAKDIFQESLAIFLLKIKDTDFKLTCKVSTYIYAIAKRLFMRLNRERVQKYKIDFTDEENIALEEFRLRFTPIDISKHDLVEEVQHKDDEQARKMVISVLTHPKFKSCKELIMDAFFSESKLTMEEIATNNAYANAKVAKNKKSKCLKKLRSIVSKIPFFKHYLQD